MEHEIDRASIQLCLQSANRVTDEISPGDDGRFYDEGVNYMFSASFPWGGVLSVARFDGPDKSLFLHRSSKQALCALIKSFGVPISSDLSCVTSYCHGLDEFDLKGSRPNAETRALFDQGVANLNRAWLEHKTFRQSPQPP